MDPVHGDNASALVGHFDKPYATIGGADGAASALTSDTQQVIVRAGLYTESDVLANLPGAINVVNIHYENGAQYSGVSAALCSTSGLQELNITGQVKASMGSFVPFINRNSSAKVFFEFKELIGCSYPVEMTTADAGEVFVKGDSVFGIGYAQAIGPADLIVNVGRFQNTGPNVKGYFVDSGASGNHSVHVGYAVTDSGNANKLVEIGANGAVTANISLTGSFLDKRASGASASTIELYSGNVNLDCNVTCTDAARAILVGNNSDSLFANITGFYKTQNEAVALLRGSSKNVYMRGYFETVAYERAIELNGTSVTLNAGGDIITKAPANGHGIYNISGENIVQVGPGKIISSSYPIEAAAGPFPIFIIGGITVNVNLDGSNIVNQTPTAPLTINSSVV